MHNVFPDWLFLPLLVLGILAIYTVSTVLACLWERRLVWPYVPMEGPEPEPNRPDRDHDTEANPYAVGRAVEGQAMPAETPYARTTNRLAEAMGFEPLGIFRDGKGKLYRIRYDFWLDPGGEVMAEVGGGSLASIPINATWLFTLLADGRRLVTVNGQNASEFDLAKLTDEALVAGAGFPGLLDAHRARVAASPVPAVLFSEDDPLGDHRAFMARRADRLEQLGHLRYLDPERTAWRYTLKGAVAFALLAYLNGMRRVFWHDSWAMRLRSRSPRVKPKLPTRMLDEF